MNNSTILEDDNGTMNAENGQQASFLTPSVLFIYNVYLLTSFVLGVTGNGLVLMVFARFKASTSTDWFIIFITIFDFISSVVNVPVYFTFTSGRWQKIGSDIFCKLHMFVSQSVVLSSTFLVCGLAIERYLKICRRNGFKISKALALQICIAISSFATLLSVPCFEMFKNVRGQCNANPLLKGVFFYYLMVLFTYILAFVIVTYCYSRISVVVLKSESNVNKHTNGTAPVSNTDTNTDSWCCVSVNRIGRSKNKVAPSSFATLSSSNQTQPESDMSSVRTSKGNVEKNACRPERSSNFLVVPQVSKGTKLSTLSQSAESSVSGLNGCSGSGSLRRSDNFTQSVSVRPITKINQGKRTTRVTFAVCLIFILSWLPPWIAFCVLSVKELRAVPNIIMFGLFGKMTYLLNTFMNPILYLTLNRKFRKQTGSLLCFWKRQPG